MSFLKDKKGVLKSLGKSIGKADKLSKNFQTAHDSFSANPSPENQTKLLKATLKYTGQHAEITRNLAITILVYCAGGSFDGDLATMLNKMGRGNEALQEIWNQKLNGEG